MSRLSSRLACAVATTGVIATSVVASLLSFPRVASAGQVAPYTSEHFLPSSNGIGAIAYDAFADPDQNGYSLTQFLQHPYRYASDEGVPTLNFGYSTYPGIRIGGVGSQVHAWLNTVKPQTIEYLAGTGIIHVVHQWSGLTIDEYHFTPLDLAGTSFNENASVMLVKVTRGAAAPAGTIDAYAIFNNHLGTDLDSNGNHTGNPGTDGEGSNFSNGNIYEFGNSGATIGYASIGAASHHGMAPDNPYPLFNMGADLTDDNTSGSATEAVVGFENSIGDLASGSSGWAGWLTVLSPNDGADHVGNVQKWVAGRSPSALLTAEQAGVVVVDHRAAGERQGVERGDGHLLVVAGHVAHGAGARAGRPLRADPRRRGPGHVEHRLGP